MQNIPSVDLSDFLSNEPKRKEKFVHEIGSAFEDIGFVALKGHFLDQNLVEDLDFRKALFGIWLEDRCVDRTLKKRLLGK